MITWYSDKAQGLTPGATAGAATPQGGTAPISPYGANDVVSVRATLALPAAASAATGDIAAMLQLPAGCEPVDAMIVSDAVDTGAGVVMELCTIDNTLAAVVASTDLIASTTVGQAGGVARASTAAGLNQAASLSDQWIGIKFTTGVTTAQAGNVRLVYTYRAGTVLGI